MHYFGDITFYGAAEKCVVNFGWGQKLLGNSSFKEVIFESNL